MKIDERNEIFHSCTGDDITKTVISEFAEFCRIPRGSGNEREITEYLKQRLISEGLHPETDRSGNLICDIPASSGCEESPLTVLQGHTDMVCAVRDDSYSPERDPVVWQLAKEHDTGREILCTDGRSSLGADCGLGDAVLLWLLFESGCSHGPLRLIFTVEEEIGLAGAKKLDPSVFDDVKYVINVDGFHWGRLIAGSAGGSRETYRTEAQLIPLPEDEISSGSCIALELGLFDFHGGHSGYDIDKGRANVIKLLNSLLYFMKRDGIPYRLSGYNGGIGHNVIPGEVSATIVMRREDMLAFQRLVSIFMRRLIADYEKTDPNGLFRYNEVALPEFLLVQSQQDRLIRFIENLSDGVLYRMEEIEGVIDTSSNLGMVRFDSRRAGKDSRVMIEIMSFVRSMTPAYHDEVISSHRKEAEVQGFREEIDEYRTWVFDPQNPLLHIMADIYREIAGSEPEITAVHVGLEPSAFCEKSEDLHMINVGADVIDPHTVHERVHTDTIRPFAFLMAKTLEKIARPGA